MQYNYYRHYGNEGEVMRGKIVDDLTGKVFGKLTVIKRAPDKSMGTQGRHIVMWTCRCECGTIKDISADSLRSGGHISCGCVRQRQSQGSHLVDLTGQQFGYWTVLYRASDRINKNGKHDTMWHCRCKCGTEKDVAMTSLRGHTTSSCGCYKMSVLSFENSRDLTGQVFGRWTVLYRADNRVTPKGRSLRYWHCKCSCGREKDVVESALISGKSVSCGCYRKERFAEKIPFEDLTGKQFGDWTVLERLPDKHTGSEKKNRIQLWRVRCSCGTEKVVSRTILKQGNSTSCGCKNRSTLELYVKQWLDENGFTYKHQQTFDNLYINKGHPLFYDFAIYVNDKIVCLIECQGKQHFKAINWFGGEERFKRQQLSDNYKKTFAQSRGLPLFCVLYNWSIAQIHEYLKKCLIIYK